MTHNLDLILTLSAGLIAALALGYVASRLGWSPIVGYLLAGVLLGPYTPGFTADRHLADQLSEIGVILLMFGVGLHFHLKDLLAVRTVAVTGAIFQSSVATILGATTVVALGWTWSSGIVFGLSLSVASTVVLTRILADNDELQSPVGRTAVGWLVVEDLLTVLLLVLLPVLFRATEQPDERIVSALGIATLKLGVFIAFTLVVGGRVIPWLLTKVARTRSRELFTLGVLAIALGIAVSSTYFFSVSMALGAFLAGMVVGQSEFSARAGAEALPMRDAFAVMFFLSVGMLLDPWQIGSAPLLTVATIAVVMIGKPLAALVIVCLLGYGSSLAIGVALALAQIGEFSFLVAVLGRDLGILPETAINAIVTASMISIVMNPFLYRSGGSFEAALRRTGPLWRILNWKSGAETKATTAAALSHRAVVVGYGPIGRTVARLLGARGIEPVIIEMNIQTFRSLRDGGIRAVYGDANQREVLIQAGIRQAGTFILSASGADEFEQGIRIARELNPGVHIVARADFLRQSDGLLKAGANEVFSGEGEVVLSMTDSILRNLGATPEQLDEERARIRSDLFQATVSKG